MASLFDEFKIASKHTLIYGVGNVLSKALGRDMPTAEGQDDGLLAFSPPMPHGTPNTHLGTVMMTRIEAGDVVFVHASDIQLLDDNAVSLILDWRPDLALVGGPLLYLPSLSSEERALAWANAKRLARHVSLMASIRTSTSCPTRSRPRAPSRTCATNCI